MALGAVLLYAVSIGVSYGLAVAMMPREMKEEWRHRQVKARAGRPETIPPPKWHLAALALVSLGVAIAIWEPILFKPGEVIITTLIIFETGRRFLLSRLRG